MPRKPKSIDAPARVPAAKQVSDLLRQDILARSAGEFLGNEDELMARYGVSRPTFRQSVRMLEQEQLLEVRRGAVGGFYARKPTINTVGRIAATFLESRNTTPEHLFEASHAATSQMIRLATHSHNEIARQALRNVTDKLAATDVLVQEHDDFHALELESRTCLSRLADNPALDLIYEMLYLVAMDEPRPSVFLDKNARRTEWKKLRLRLNESVLNRETDVAAALGDRVHQAMLQWRAEDQRAEDKETG